MSTDSVGGNSNFDPSICYKNIQNNAKKAELDFAMMELFNDSTEGWWIFSL